MSKTGLQGDGLLNLQDTSLQNILRFFTCCLTRPALCQHGRATPFMFMHKCYNCQARRQYQLTQLRAFVVTYNPKSCTGHSRRAPSLQHSASPRTSIVLVQVHTHSKTFPSEENVCFPVEYTSEFAFCSSCASFAKFKKSERRQPVIVKYVLQRNLLRSKRTRLLRGLFVQEGRLLTFCNS